MVKTHFIDVGILIDIDYRRDILELEKEFKNIDVSDPISLQSWFAAHPYLTVHDMAKIAKVCVNTVYIWRRIAKWEPPPIFPLRTSHQRPPRPEPRRSMTPVAPPDWDINWLIAAYQSGYSIPQLARATKRSIFGIKNRLKKRIKLRSKKDSVRTKHPCFNLAWVYEHYVRRCLSQRQCAKIAKVDKRTIATWLNYFNIRVRSHTEQLLIDYGSDLGKITSLSPLPARHSKQNRAVAN